MAAPAAPSTRSPRRLLAVALALALALVATVLAPGSASAAQAPVGLGTANAFAVLGAATVTNTGSSVIAGDIGVGPGGEVPTGLPDATIAGTTHVNDGVVSQAQVDAGTAYDDAAARSPRTDVSADLGDTTLVAGVYGTDSSLGLTGTLTLDAKGDPAAVFVFQAGSTLTTATGSKVLLINGANPCNVVWQITSSATLGTNSTFVGTVLALASVSAKSGAIIDGRLVARTGAVTLDTNTLTASDCSLLPPVTTTTAASSTTAAPTTATTAPATTAPATTAPATTAPATTAPATTSTTEAGPTTTVVGATTTLPTATTEVPATTAPATTAPATTAPATTAPATTEVPATTAPATTEVPTTVPVPPTSVDATILTTTTLPGTPSSIDQAQDTTTTTAPGSRTTAPNASSTTIDTQAEGTTTVPGQTTTKTSVPGTTTESLARTGSDSVRPTLAGILSILLGAVLVLAARRRSALRA